MARSIGEAKREFEKAAKEIPTLSNTLAPSSQNATRDPLIVAPKSLGIATEGKEKRQAHLEHIILDGQQRITSLYYALKAPDFALRGSNTPLFFYVNLPNLVSTSSNQGEIIEALATKLEREVTFRKMLFPLYELANYDVWTDGLEDYMRRQSKADLDRIRPLTRFIERKLHNVYSDFEIPYVALPKTMTLSQVTDIFEKINTTGKVLSVFDLVIARLSKYGIELRRAWEKALEQHDRIREYYKTYHVDEVPIHILQAISLTYNRTGACKREDILNIYQNVFEAKDMPSFEQIWFDMADYVERAMAKLENLREDGFGARNPSEIPYTIMIPALAALLKNIESQPDRKGCYDKLKTWYWAAVFSEAYSTAADTQLTIDFNDVKIWFSDETRIPRTVANCRRIINTLDFRDIRSRSNAKYRGVLSIIALKEARDFDSGQTLENAPDNDKDHLFPKNWYGDERWIDSVLNMTWMSKETNQKIKRTKQPSEFIKSKGSDFPSLLETHCISKQAYECMVNNDFEGFLWERQKSILEEIAKRVGAELEATPESFLISPTQPFSNKMAFRAIVRSCDGYIKWVDKYLIVEGLDLLYESIFPNREGYQDSDFNRQSERKTPQVLQRLPTGDAVEGYPL